MRAEFIYVGVCKSSGRIIAAYCDAQGYEKNIAKNLADWVRRGLVVERLSDTEYQARIRASRTKVSAGDQKDGGGRG